MRRGALLVSAAIVCVAGFGGVARAQEPITLEADLLFYGDNTEFRNPFREGETIFGAAVHAAAAIGFGERVELRLGAFGNTRFGSDSAFELVRPVVSLLVKGGGSRFVFGTFPLATPGSPPGPDRTGPHGLLPPLQRETLAFDRPHEAGFLWILATGRLEHEAWLNWQRLNTSEHRERFDTGVNARVRIGGPLSVPVQFHLVHEGGQLFAAGPVSDSIAGGTGVVLEGALGPFSTAALEVLGLLGRDTPDRELPAGDREGPGFFGRASAARAGWRGHILFWRGRDFITREGDPNYLSVRRDGTTYRGIRDYSEAGVTRTFAPARGVLLEASGRIHRVEKDYGYSYRVLATVSADWRVR
jgi:hypothetical protein